MLVVLTGDLPGHLPHARKILGDRRSGSSEGRDGDLADELREPHAALNARHLAPLLCA
jgi:hypothetical protein